MNIDDFSFHDAQIIEVRETCGQTIDFWIYFPVDWENNVFEKKILRFKDVINYFIKEIPFAEQPTILKITNLGQVKMTFGSDRNQIEVMRNKIEIHTNAGTRMLEYSECDLIEGK